MSHLIVPKSLIESCVGFCEHAFFVIGGFVLMVLGLALGVTMVMLPVGIVIGLIGFAMFVGGMTVRMDRS